VSPFKLQAFNHIAIVTVRVAQVEAPIGRNWSHYHRGCWCLQRFILILILILLLLPGHEVPNLHAVPMVNSNHSVYLSVCLSVCLLPQAQGKVRLPFQFAPPETKACSGREIFKSENKLVGCGGLLVRRLEQMSP
jgi:hypothetical protein